MTAETTPPPAQPGREGEEVPPHVPTPAGGEARRIKNAAWVAAAAAILAAIIAAAGSWSAARTAADAATQAVSTQLSGETEKSRAEFLRTQRQSVYAKAITHEQNLLESLDHYLTATRTGQFDVKVHNRLAPALYRNHQLLSQDKTNIDIIASDACREAFDAWFTEHDRILIALSQLTGHRAKPPNQPPFDFVKGQLAARDAKEKFLDAARIDMRG